MSVGDLNIYLLAENDSLQGSLFQESFHNFPNVTVTRNPFEDMDTIDCLVIPCSSSFGFNGQPLAEIYMNKLGDKMKEKVKKYILTHYFGEQQPGSAFILKNSSETLNYRYIAFLSLCRVPFGNIPYDYAYTAMRGLLISILEFNNSCKQKSDTIEVVTIPTFSFGDSSPSQKKLHVKHMALAYRNMVYPMRHLPSKDEYEILNGQIFDKVSESIGERKNIIRELIVSEKITKRGLYNEEELNFLIELIESENDLRKLAAKSLASLINNDMRSEFTLSCETMCSTLVKSKNGLAYMLDEAERGSFSLYREIKPNEIVIGDLLGSGTEACVYKATWNGKMYAIKKFKGIPNYKEFRRELSIMSLLQHPNLVRCYGGYANTSTDTYYLLMDLMDVDINQILSTTTFWKTDYPQILRIALQAAKGMCYLHDCNLIHRDLKSVNLLIDKNYSVKVCDFGLSRVVARKKQNMTGNVGTVSWIAPEVFEQQPYDAKADVYSFGMVLWELYTKKIPFEDINTFEIPVAVIRGDRPAIPKDCPKEYAKLIKECWHKKPSKRPAFSKIVKVLTKLNNEQVNIYGSDIAKSIPKTIFKLRDSTDSISNLDESQSSSGGDDQIIKSYSTENISSTNNSNFTSPIKILSSSGKLRRRTQSTSTLDKSSKIRRKSGERKKSPPSSFRTIIE